MRFKASFSNLWMTQCAIPVCLLTAILVWNTLAVGGFSFLAASWLLSMIFSGALAGDLILRYAFQDSRVAQSLPGKLGVGFLFVSVCYYIVCLALPFGMVSDWILVVASVGLLWCGVERTRWNSLIRSDHKSECIFVAVALLAITCWCWDLLRPIEFRADVAVIQTWSDVYYHLSQINAFASSTGLRSISDVQMAGGATHPYHFASYVLPAALVSVTGSSALAAYSGLLVPLGLLLSVFAAYTLALSVFGHWPAVAAGLAVLFLPDAYQQGFGNSFFGYHWLQQVGPAGSYGVACAAIAIMFMLEACKSGSYKSLLISYVFLVSTLLFKAQIFVALSFVIWIFPPLFMNGMRRTSRAIALLLMLGIYFGAVVVSQKLPSVPIMQIDGSGLFSYSTSVMHFQADGLIKQFATFAFKAAGDVWIIRACAFAVMLLLCTFGVLAAFYFTQIGYLKRRFEPAIWLLPIVIVLVYLLMATGLALDSRHIGMSEELLHRPFVWAYYFLVIWTTAAIYYRCLGDTFPGKSSVRWLLLSLVMFGMTVPFFFGKGIQTLKSWGRGYQEVPACAVHAAQFIRVNSRAGELVQDAMNDPNFVLSALSGRSAFAIDSGGFRVPDGLPYRLKSLNVLKTFVAANEVESFMMSSGIKWYLLGPTAKVAWATELKSRIVFQCGEYVLYGF